MMDSDERKSKQNKSHAEYGKNGILKSSETTPETGYGYLILSGGKNRRMEGRTKLFMKVCGRTQLENIKDVIEKTEKLFCQRTMRAEELDGGRAPCDIWLSTAEEGGSGETSAVPSGPAGTTGDEDEYRKAGLPLIGDIRCGCGPMGGIASALIKCGREALVVIPSDFYAEGGEALLPLLEGYAEKKCPVFFRKKDGGLLPLPGIYTKKMLPMLTEAMEAENFRLGKLIEKFAEDNEIKAAPLSKEPAFYNLNTPKDVIETEELMHMKKQAEKSDKSLVMTLEEAFYKLKRETHIDLKTEVVPVLEALGRYIGEDCFAPHSQPPFDRSPLDGYAVNAQDTENASEDKPAVLAVTESSYAGETRRLSIERGEAVRIMTGAPVPEGADAVIKQELTDCGEGERKENGTYKKGKVKIFSPIFSGANIVEAGEDYRKGKLIIRKGEKAGAAHIALLASMGKASVAVSPEIKISVFSTGDELKTPGESLEYGKIYDSNLYAAAALFKACGEKLIHTKRLPDDIERTAEEIKNAFRHSDIVVTTGGVSVGQKDIMPEVLKRLSAKLVFSGLLLKPGMPTKCALYEGKPVFCLSGNPTAAYTAMELLIKPFLRVIHGIEEDDPWHRRRAVLITSVNKESPGRRLIRGNFSEGRVYFPEGSFSSGSFCGIEASNCFIDIPAGSGRLRKGTVTDILPFEPENKAEIKKKMRKPFIYAVSGYKNTGKTRLMGKLIRRLTAEGLKVACIKHDGHDFTPDVPGTDSFSFREAGACGCAVFSQNRFMVTKEGGCDEKILLESFPEADIILIEGLKNSVYPKYICDYPEHTPDEDKVFEELMRLYHIHREAFGKEAL